MSNKAMTLDDFEAMAQRCSSTSHETVKAYSNPDLLQERQWQLHQAYEELGEKQDLLKSSLLIFDDASHIPLIRTIEDEIQVLKERIAKMSKELLTAHRPGYNTLDTVFLKELHQQQQQEEQKLTASKRGETELGYKFIKTNNSDSTGPVIYRFVHKPSLFRLSKAQKRCMQAGTPIYPVPRRVSILDYGSFKLGCIANHSTNTIYLEQAGLTDSSMWVAGWLDSALLDVGTLIQ